LGSILDENDLKAIFGEEKEKAPEPIIEVTPEPLPEVAEPKVPEKVYAPAKFTWQTLVKFLSIFLGIFIVSYFSINEPAIAKKMRYSWDVSLLRRTYSKVVPTPTAEPFNAASRASLVIPKIGVDAPIAWNVQEADLKDKLLESVAHSQGTALPGVRGNIFITGHSSYYAWVDSPYKDVFALLDKLSPGDKIYIKYDSKVFTYEVSGSKIVAANDSEVMNQGENYILTLMTCVPIGTNLNRLIVTSNQISSSASI